MIALVDATTRRQAELARILAAFATVDPGKALELVNKLRSDDLVDERARRFLLALKPGANPMGLAYSLNLDIEYARWLEIACDRLFTLSTDAERAVDEIKRLVITRDTVSGLSAWIRETAQVGGYTYAG